MLEFSPNQGAVVTSWDDQELREKFELRAVLESYAAGRAALRANDECIRQLRSMAEQQYEESRARSDGYLERIAELNRAFHREIILAAGNKMLSNAVANLTEAPLVALLFRHYSEEALLRSALHHLDLVEAIEAHDADWAESVMHSHILAARAAFVPEPSV